MLENSENTKDACESHDKCVPESCNREHNPELDNCPGPEYYPGVDPTAGIKEDSATNGRKFSIASKNKAWMKRTLKNTIKLAEILHTEEILTLELYSAFKYDYGDDFKEFNFSDEEKRALEDIATILTFDTASSATGAYFTQLLTELKNLNINHVTKKTQQRRE